VTAVVMVILAAAVAAWVLAPLRTATGPAAPRAWGGGREETDRDETGDGPGVTMGRTPEGER
jgi:hypothetical protein